MTTKEVAEHYGVARITVIKWCKKNGIKREMVKGGIMAFSLTKTDCKKFEKRSKKGRPSKKA